MKNNKISACFLALFMGVVIGSLAGSAFAQQSAQASPQRPVYLDILPVAGAENSILPDDVVATMAREALAGAHQAVIRMHGQTLPAGVRVVRIMYIVHQQSEDDGMTLAASASTELLRTAVEGDGGMQTFSIYSGQQQTLVQGPDLEHARRQLREAFRAELQQRIRSAFGSDASQ